MGIAWSKSGQVELHQLRAAAGALAYFYQGNTTVPITTYQDADETTPRTNPVVADADGRWPLTFIPYMASYDVKVITSGGTELYYHRELPNPDPVEEAEDDVDDSQLIQTGDTIWSPKTGTRTGFVRLNARTIGSASSGATERANDDTEDLYTFLWNNLADDQAAVTGGRGASAAADFAANKPIALLDGRASLLMGLDDMGGSAASRLSSVTFGNGDATTAGSVAGTNTHTLTTAQTPGHTHTFSATSSSDGSHTHTGTTASTSINHNHSITDPVTRLGEAQSGTGQNEIWRGSQAGTTGSDNPAHTHTFTTASGGAHTHTISGTTASTGDGSAHPIVSRSLLGTFYQKL